MSRGSPALSLWVWHLDLSPACLLPLPTCCRVARSQMRTVWSRDTVAICPRFCSVESANTGAMWERANTVYSREGTSRKPRWPEVVVDSTRRPSGLKETELTGPSCSVGRVGQQPLGPSKHYHTHYVGTEVPKTDRLFLCCQGLQGSESIMPTSQCPQSPCESSLQRAALVLLGSQVQVSSLTP